PYMGKDSVSPFLSFKDKWVFLLALTSNPSSQDFQHHSDEGEALYEKVLKKGKEWDEESEGHLGFVVGATQASSLAHIRSIVPDSYLLIPGVGAQGGDLDAVCAHGKNQNGEGMLINSSRGIIYAGSGKDFAQEAGNQARHLQSTMKGYL
ncbi:MAG: orotidine-5'-phosphate decarboxylase, partial [Bacteroidota bacterium]